MPAAPSRLDRFLPPSPLARRLAVQSVLFATGEGAFLTRSAVFRHDPGRDGRDGTERRATERYLARMRQPVGA
jgi:hypothetical protein